MTIESGKVVGVFKENKQWPQWLAVFSATICLFTAGICFTWSSPSLAILQGPNAPFNITNNEASWIASLLPFGSALGPIFGSMCAKYLGPKQAIITSAIPFMSGFVLIIFAKGASHLYISRFLSGIGVGFGFSAVPIYIGEIAENKNRGALMILFSLMLGIGSSIPVCIGPYISIQLLAIISCMFPLLLLATFVFMPDSPYYLIKIGKDEEAKKSLKWLRRQTEDDAVEGELNIIKKCVGNNYAFFESFKEIIHKPNPKALLIIFCAVLGQQFSGVLAVAFYQEQIYASSNVPISPEIAVIVSQVIGTVSGFAAIFFVDRWGRKPLLVSSSIGCAFSTAMIGGYFQFSDIQETYPMFTWLPVIALNTFVIFFSIGLGPIPYTVLGEVFSSSFKEVATCMISVGGAIAGFAVTKLFQVFNDIYGTAAVFFILTTASIVLLIVNIIILPETMNKSLLDIQNLLMNKSESGSETNEKYSQQNGNKI